MKTFPLLVVSILSLCILISARAAPKSRLVVPAQPVDATGATENFLGSPCRFCTFSFDVCVEQQLSSELERQTNSTRKDKHNAIHGHRQSLERLR